LLFRSVCESWTFESPSLSQLRNSMLRSRPSADCPCSTLCSYPPAVDGLSFAPLASLPELRHLSIDQRDYHDHTELSDAQVA